MSFQFRHVSFGIPFNSSSFLADAHAHGARPFRRREYVQKLEILTAAAVDAGERDRFLDLVDRLPELDSAAVRELNLTATSGELLDTDGAGVGLF